MSNTLVIIGHPFAGSFNHALASRYVDGMRTASDSDVRVIDLAARPFEGTADTPADLRAPEGATTHLDPEISEFIDDIAWADHLVFFFPQWWGTYPAVLKAFLDRALLSGTAFAYGRGHLSTGLLAGKTARIVMTMDTPTPWNRFVYRNAAETSLKRATLAYCGIRTVGITRFTPIRFSTPEKRAEWLASIQKLATTDAARRPTRERAGLQAA